MEPWFAKNDKKMFYKYLDKATYYFEYGSGGSTYQAILKTNISKIYSIESDFTWYSKLKSLIHSNITYIYNDMNTEPHTWGHPGKNSTPEQRINYSNHMLLLNKDKQQQLDLILIDGRFRVACCLKCFDVITNNCIILFDDFLNRPEYHVVLDYYDIIEQTDDNRMVALKKKTNSVSVDEALIAKYELIAD